MGIPPYLFIYLLKIRGHENEPGYLRRESEGKSLEEALYEKGLFSELLDRHLVFRSTKNDHATFDAPSAQQMKTGFTSRGDNTQTVYFPRRFLVAPAGKQAIRVAVFRFAFWVAVVCLGALLSSLVASVAPWA